MIFLKESGFYQEGDVKIRYVIKSLEILIGFPICCYCDSGSIQYSDKENWIKYCHYKEMEWKKEKKDSNPKLKAGMIVELLDGSKWLVIKQYNSELLLISNEGYDLIKYYDENLNNIEVPSCGICKVYIPKGPRYFDGFIDDENLDLLWERDDVPKKQMTLDDIEKELGYKVEIIE